MTGISHERLVGQLERFATYTYDSMGRAKSSEQAGGANRIAVDYSLFPAGSVATDAFGSVRAEGFITVDGLLRGSSRSQPGGAGCGPASASISYDGQANVTSRTDFTNRRTCYGYDLTRNLETARVEGLSAATACPSDLSSHVPPANTEQRKVLTQWHPTWRLQTRMAEAKKISTWVYHGQPDPTAGGALASCAPADALVDGQPIAVLCKMVEQATSDETGAAGFGATAVGAARIESWTYNRHGQKLTHDGPRTDVADLTSYSYYTDTQADWTMGDLRQISNALGQITRFTKYDRNGRLLQQIDANGSVTDYAYTARGWLREVKLTPAGGGAIQTSSYEYDGVGQLKKATAADGSYTEYSYDAAHRLIRVADSAGHRVDYTLDAMGNRTREDWTDPAGVLRKTLSRSIDALNRVQQVVGGVQ
jgi:YD repeat-containing protein